MTPSRLGVGSAVLLALLGMQVWQTLSHRDDWPFSTFPMYSHLQSKYVSREIAVGVSQAGEFPLSGEHTSPISGSRLRHAMRRGARGKQGQRLRDAVIANYYARAAEGKHHSGEITALRVYRETWKIRPKLKGMDKPHRKLLAATPALPPHIVRQLEAEARNQAEVQSPVEARAGEVILEAEAATPHGNVKPAAERYASQGRALLLPAEPGSGRKPKAEPQGYADLDFEISVNGTYFVWLRGKATKERSQDSLWLQLDGRIGERRSLRKHGMGHFGSAYPKNAFAWAGATPEDPGVKVRLKKGKHRLRISSRQGPVVLDQIVLSRTRKEHPVAPAPLTGTSIKEQE